MWQALERRRNPRVRLEALVIFVQGEAVRSCAARDLSAGGMYLDGSPAPPLGSQVRVEVHVGPRFRLRVTGRVVRVDRRPGDKLVGFAIEFENVDPADRERLERAVVDLRGAG